MSAVMSLESYDDEKITDNKWSKLTKAKQQEWIQRVRDTFDMESPSFYFDGDETFHGTFQLDNDFIIDTSGKTRPRVLLTGTYLKMDRSLPALEKMIRGIFEHYLFEGSMIGLFRLEKIRLE